MNYLYGIKSKTGLKLAATFDTEQQLLAYVGWATLSRVDTGQSKFEQGSALASFETWKGSNEPLTAERVETVVHNPSPSML